MNILYDTFTGKVEKFVKKLPSDYNPRHISEYDGDSLYYLVTSTINFGEVLKTTSKFMKLHGDKCLGVSSSGNRIWGRNYGVAANILAKEYNIPIISKFELDGKQDDVDYFIYRINKLENERNKNDKRH